MGRTIRTQVALYLDADKVKDLKRLAKETGRTSQDVLREALDREIARHAKAKAKRSP